MPEERLTFALVHGGAHGAWCWDRVVGELNAAGHRGVAVDLPCEDATAGAAAYACVVVQSLESFDGPVVVVGHSLGGLTAPLVATQRSAVHLVFLAALLPVPGKSLREQQAEEPEMMFPYSGGRAGLRQRFYNTCSDEDADLAMSRIRDQSLAPFTETTPLSSWPGVPRSYIVCSDDRACNPAWARRVVPERLGVEPVELPGTGHSPFLDRPAELTALFLDLVSSR